MKMKKYYNGIAREPVNAKPINGFDIRTVSVKRAEADYHVMHFKYYQQGSNDVILGVSIVRAAWVTTQDIERRKGRVVKRFYMHPNGERFVAQFLSAEAARYEGKTSGVKILKTFNV